MMFKILVYVYLYVDEMFVKFYRLYLNDLIIHVDIFLHLLSLIKHNTVADRVLYLFKFDSYPK